MTPKAILKITVDLLMMLALLAAMGYHLWGRAAHEWIGVGLFGLFIAHHILNWNWHKSLFKGKYTPMRALGLCINALIFATMLIQIYSGIAMSQYVFDFPNFAGGMSVTRKLHILGSYWGFLLISLHLGLHWNVFIKLAGRLSQIKTDTHADISSSPPKQKRQRLRFALAPLLGALVGVYGVFVFLKRDFPTYLLLQSEFVFMDYEESWLLFYLDYLALIGLCVFISYYTTKILLNSSAKNQSDLK